MSDDRSISVEDARRVMRANFSDPISWALANTVVAQAEQIAAVLALHSGDHWCTASFDDEAIWYRTTLSHCPTVRALGVTE